MMMGLPELLGTALAGLAVGFLAGVFGLGGGFLIVPVLRILLGIDVKLAVGAAVCQVLGPTTTALLVRRPRREDFRLPLIVIGGQAVGTILGVTVLDRVGEFGTNGEFIVAGASVPATEFVVMSLYFAILLTIGGFAIWETRRAKANDRDIRGCLSACAIPPCYHSADFARNRVSIPLMAWFGMGIGFLSGLLGITGGLLLLPGLVYLWGMRTQAAVRASLVMVWIGAIPATIAHAWHGNIDLRIVMALLVGGTVGARLGAEIGSRLAGRKLRQQFGWVLLGTAAIVAYRLVELFRL